MARRRRIVAFCCEQSAAKAFDALQGKAVARGVDVIRVPCAGRVEVARILRCFEEGARGVLLAGCPLDNCRFIKGNRRALKRVEEARQALREAGYETPNVDAALVASVDSHRLSEALKEMKRS